MGESNIGVIHRASTPRVVKCSKAEVNPGLGAGMKVCFDSFSTWQVAITIAIRVFEGERIHLEKRKARVYQTNNGQLLLKSNLIYRGRVPPWRCQWHVWREEKEKNRNQQRHLWMTKKSRTNRLMRKMAELKWETVLISQESVFQIALSSFCAPIEGWLLLSRCRENSQNVTNSNKDCIILLYSN